MPCACHVHVVHAHVYLHASVANRFPVDFFSTVPIDLIVEQALVGGGNGGGSGGGGGVNGTGAGGGVGASGGELRSLKMIR